MDDHISFRLYPDTRPHCLEIAQLHKGLVLVLDGNELVEEGAGFGCPVVKYFDEAYFSTSAQSSIQRTRNGAVLTKCFNMDAISRKTVGNSSYVNEDFYSLIHKIFEMNYLRHKSFVSAFNIVMMLRKLLKINTQFVKADPRGKIAVKYETVTPDELQVTVDLSKLKQAGCEEILILNEQGSTFFREYADSDGLSLYDRTIGAWDAIAASEASLSDSEQRLTWTLHRVKEARLFRGWEQTRGRFSWAGLGYSLPPGTSWFSYSLKLARNRR